ncbi:hypothetical protein BU24DRAFT_421382 [Aaosphaeria arxii CBS 175.79]|uniref:PDZ GRASP-type domain-containing protein n=1 Tax=Aaosphaeria arxii CBS 175.79 TaxID=1450172 RepID=A0A6A5XYM5_9PLEO|nr:uncharacterized protein BU24DRAFT_421382 [Aaosphaeria arxii CBS 175.79]KAF2018398.1 hypothetical protein BU24DRAFT_421382 [Aaosphaeria arxii CBS 175.79]
MFGALNRFMARLDAAPEEERSSVEGAYGFQVLRNTNTELALEPWFDFIIGINGRTIDNPDPNLFATEVRNCAGTTISLGVFSAKGQKVRETYLPIPPNSPTLGLTLQWTPLTAAEDVWHILDVIPNSPADVAGLLPYGDYVIGSPEGIVRGESGLGELVEAHLNRPLRLLVYNHEYDVTRPLTITPSRGWGGEGALGCVLGFGALHRIPAALDEPPQAPGETMFSAAEQYSSGAAADTTFDEKSGAGIATVAGGGEQLFVPANMAIPSKSPPPPTSTSPRPGGGPPPSSKKKQRAHHAMAATGGGGGGLDDYFKEGEEKSKEEDYAPKRKDGALPPPPKKAGAGGPPPPPKGGPPKSSGTPVQATAEDE